MFSRSMEDIVAKLGANIALNHQVETEAKEVLYSWTYSIINTSYDLPSKCQQTH